METSQKEVNSASLTHLRKGPHALKEIGSFGGRSLFWALNGVDLPSELSLVPVVATDAGGHELACEVFRTKQSCEIAMHLLLVALVTTSDALVTSQQQRKERNEKDRSAKVHLLRRPYQSENMPNDWSLGLSQPFPSHLHPTVWLPLHNTPGLLSRH